MKKNIYINKKPNYLSRVMEVTQDSLTLILTLTVNDSDVQSAAISQANIDQDWLPADPQINHVH